MSTTLSITSPSETQESHESAIVFDDVAIGFGDNEVLRGVSFRLGYGETKALFGVAGSGKSLILKLALGLNPEGRTPRRPDKRLWH